MTACVVVKCKVAVESEAECVSLREKGTAESVNADVTSVVLGKC